MTCSLGDCKRVAHYRVAKRGYCDRHRAEAASDQGNRDMQAQHAEKRADYLYAGDLRSRAWQR